MVEFYSPYLNWTTEQAKDVAKLLDELNIKCLSTHNGPQAIAADNVAKTVELNQIIGSKYVIVASAGKVQGPDGWKAFADSLSAGAERLRAHKMATGFHNHQVEWKPFENGERPMDVLAKNTPKDVVLQLDAGTAVEMGVDTTAWIKANPGRIKSVHLKDWGKGEKRGYTVAFGEGDVQWKPLFQAAESTGGVEYLPDRTGARRARRRDRDGPALHEQLSEAAVCVKAVVSSQFASSPVASKAHGGISVLDW